MGLVGGKVGRLKVVAERWASLEAVVEYQTSLEVSWAGRRLQWGSRSHWRQVELVLPPAWL